MRKLALGIGTAALLTAAAAVPAMAQVGFYAGPFGPRNQRNTQGGNIRIYESNL